MSVLAKLPRMETPRPSLNALRAFEAAARLGSVTAAAGELGVSHSAISHHAWLAVHAGRARADLAVLPGDSVPEGFNESIEPRLQRVSPFRIVMANSFDDGFDLDQGGRREEQGVLMSADSDEAARL